MLHYHAPEVVDICCRCLPPGCEILRQLGYSGGSSGMGVGIDSFHGEPEGGGIERVIRLSQLLINRSQVRIIRFYEAQLRGYRRAFF